MNTASIVLVATGAVLLNIIMGIFERKTTKGEFVQECSLDEGVTEDDENREVRLANN